MRDASINPLKSHAHKIQTPDTRISYRRNLVAAGILCLALDSGIRLKRRLLPALNFCCISHLA
jgi:hypothetical protein